MSIAVATVLLIDILASGFCLRTVRASETIYIRINGSIDPVTAPIQRNGEVYTLIGSIIADGDGIVIERNDTVLVGAGYTVRGINNPSSKGIYLSGCHNVTIRDLDIKGFESGILLDAYSSNNRVSGNKAEDNEYGISCWGYSDGNNISVNNITTNRLAGIWLVGSSNNTVSRNNIVRNNQYGLSLERSSNNSIYHNNFINNTNQIRIYDSTDFWDNGYPSGGNYWTDLSSADNYRGPNQDQLGSDGIFDTPYSIDVNNQDRYPLTSPYTPAFVTDVNKDGKVNILDIAIVAQAYGSSPGQGRWNPACDFDHNNIINIIDMAMVAKDFGRST